MAFFPDKESLLFQTAGREGDKTESLLRVLFPVKAENSSRPSLCQDQDVADQIVGGSDLKVLRPAQERGEGAAL